MHFYTLLTAALLTVTLAADPQCMNGLKSRGVCCPKECGTCGGPKCGTYSKMTKTLCCIGSIEASDYDCRTSSAPCKIYSDTLPEEMPKPDPWCETGILKGNVCCPAGCKTCGGKGCSKRGRLIDSKCCISGIKRKNNSCMTYGPPCVITENKMTPEPTEKPLPRVCAEMTTADIGGCFCYLTISKRILVKRRKIVIGKCKEIFKSRGAIKMFAPKCAKFIDGRNALEKRLKLVRKINKLIPICLPEGTPLIVLKD